MIPPRTLWMRLQALLHRRRLEREMADELRFHLEMQEAANRAAGMDPEEARFAARRQFGHLDGVTEAMRDQRAWVGLEQLGKDVGFAVRALRRSPGFLAAGVPTLAFGIGLCTTIFSLVNPILFRPLPFAEPGRLVFLNETNPRQNIQMLALSYFDYLAWRKENRVFTGSGVLVGVPFTLAGAARPERIEGCLVSASLFPVLGVRPVLGRNFTAADERPDAPPVVLLGHGLWQQRYGADPGIVGRTLLLNGRRHTVVGVMPPGVSVPGTAVAWTPLIIPAPEATRGSHTFAGIARLRAGVTLDQAAADLATISRRLEQEFPATNSGVQPLLKPLREQFLGNDLRRPSWLALAAVGFVLVVACANVANLFLARALTRRQEFAVRAAFGASRGRVVRQLLAEGLVVAGTAGALGVGLAAGGVRLVLALVPVEIPPWIRFGVDWRVAGFTAGISLLTCLLFGLAPAWRAGRVKVREALEESGRGATADRRHHRLRGLLVVAEVAIATLLLTGAGLMLRTLRNLQQVDPGFDADRLTTFTVDLPLPRYAAPATRVAFYTGLLEQLRAAPGVEAAAAVSHLPMSGSRYIQSFYAEGQPVPAPGAEPIGNLRAVTPGYFAAMGIPLLEGRDFTAADRADTSPVIVIDAVLARQFFPEGSALGWHLQWSATAPPPGLEIVGVVGAVKHDGLMSGSEGPPGFYLPYAQSPFHAMTVAVRRAPDRPVGLGADLGKMLRRLDPTLPYSPPRPMADVMRQTFWMRRLLGQLLGAFSLLALALAAVGIAAMVAYTVAMRTHEIGVRRALGAGERDIISLVMRQGLRLVLAGLGLGVAASAGLSRVMAGQLFGVSPLDPAPLAISALLLGAAALFACYLPARRATRVDPLIALRAE